MERRDLGAASLMPASTALAQQDDSAIEEIVVTGSRLMRRDFTALGPITTIDHESLLNSGQPTLEDALNKLSQLQPSFGRAYTLRLTLNY